MFPTDANEPFILHPNSDTKVQFLEEDLVAVIQTDEVTGERQSVILNRGALLAILAHMQRPARSKQQEGSFGRLCG